jgi:hypothetical protein
MNNNLVIIGVGVLAFFAAKHLMNKKEEKFSNASGGYCTCSDGTSGYCAGSCATCCRRLGGAVRGVRG